MIFWDSSAVVPLLVREPCTDQVSALLRQGDTAIVWWSTVIEAWSALCRRQRQGGLSAADLEQARQRLDLLSQAWHEIAPSDVVREHTDNLLRRHPLRAADALQLGAALTLARGRPKGHRLATLDARLADAARSEGFSLALPVP